MAKSRVFQLRVCVVGFYLCFAALCLVQSADATSGIHRYRTRRYLRSRSNVKWTRKNHLHAGRKFGFNHQLDDASNTDPYVGSPFSLTPFDALPPILPLTQNTPPYCINPPSTIPSPTGGNMPLPPPGPIPSPGGDYPPLPPPGPIPSPSGGNTPLPGLGPIPSPTGGYTPLPPPGPTTPSIPVPPESAPIPDTPTIGLSPPIIIPNPPTTVPTPAQPILNPPTIIPNPPATIPTPTQPILSPPYFEPSPPYTTSPVGPVPRSPRFLPPIVFPPPTSPPTPHRGPTTAMWCVAKAAVPDPIIQEAMDYACGSGADCAQIQPSGSCFQPNTLFAHASYAFNSYWQRTKVTGGRCDLGGTAILVTVDPSFDGCHFLYF